MKKYFLFIVLSFYFVSLLAQSSDYLAIGNIYLGIDEYTFNSQKRAFLKDNPSLNGRLIEEMIGEFYNGKLYSIKIRSVEYSRWDTSRIHYEDFSDPDDKWTALYIEKYKVVNKTRINGHNYIVIKKGRCTIEVSDEEDRYYITLPTLEELKELNKKISSGQNVEHLNCSVIHIYDKSIEEQIKKNEKEREKNVFQKSLDAI